MRRNVKPTSSWKRLNPQISLSTLKMEETRTLNVKRTDTNLILVQMFLGEAKLAN